MTMIPDDNYWPTPAELDAVRRNRGYRRPSTPHHIPGDPHFAGLLVIVVLLVVWMLFL